MHESIDYFLRIGDSDSDWDDTRLTDLTPNNILASLEDGVLDDMRNIRKPTGERLTDGEISLIIKARILDGDIGQITRDYFSDLRKRSEARALPEVIPSDKFTNEAAALAMLDNYKIPLDVNKLNGSFQHLAPMWKTIYSDVETRLTIDDNMSMESNLYPSDLGFLTLEDSDGTVTKVFEVQDGDFIKVVNSEGDEEALILNSEKDHAYIIPENVRFNAIKLLGGDPRWKISESSSYATGPEFNYDTSSSTALRKDYYFFELQQEEITTEVSPKSALLKRTTAKYTRRTNLNIASEFAKYKINHKVLSMEYDDVLLDYIIDSGNLYYEQEDIVFDNDIRNKQANVYTRQIPWYIIIFPTDDKKFNPYKVRSDITRINPTANIKRELYFSPLLDPSYTDNLIQKFVTTNLVRNDDEVDIYGKPSRQGHYLTVDRNELKTGYRGEKRKTRRKSVLRKLREIVEEVTTNYITERSGDKKVLMKFDVYSRLKFCEMSELLEEANPEIILPIMERGEFGARVLPATRGPSGTKTQNTRIRYRVPDADDDLYPVIKSMRGSEGVVPPPEEPLGFSDIFTGDKLPPFFP